MTNPVEFDRSCLPSQFHLAFALAIVKQKPPDKEIKDYIMEIRRFIHNDMQVVAPDKFFDSVAFWQNAYKESEAEQAKLLNNIFELEQRVQSLRSKLRDNQTGENGGSPPAKRKLRFSEIENGQSTPAKKAQPSAAGRKKSNPKEVIDETESDEEHDVTFKLLRQIHAVQTALNRRKQPNYLTRAAVTLCKIAESEIIGAIIQLTEPKSQPKANSNQRPKKQNASSVFRAVRLSFNLTHRTLRKIMGSKDEKHYKGQIIFYLVCLFQSVMAALAQNCTAASVQAKKGNILQESANQNKMPSQSRGKGAKGKTSSVAKTNNFNTINEVAQQLTNLMCAMVLTLDLKQSEDHEIMEGILFVAIERVGKILALFTFNDRKKASDTCPGLNPPQGLTAMHEEAVTPEMVQLEAKYLIFFLERVLDGESTVNEAKHVEFLRNSKLRFQKTLLQAVFGDQDPLFQQGLVRPETPPALGSGTGGGDRQDFEEWFTGELWRLVGWDILDSAT